MGQIMRYVIAAVLRILAVVTIAWPGTLAFVQYCRTQDLFLLGVVGGALALAYALLSGAKFLLDEPRRVDTYDYDDIPFHL